MSCPWIPPAIYIGGPRHGRTAAGARRRTGTVHPPYRTPEGRIARGEQPPPDPHYTFRVDPDCDHCRWGRHYVWTETPGGAS